MSHQISEILELASKSRIQALQDGWGDFCFKEHGGTQCYVCRKRGRALYPFGPYDDISREFDQLFGHQNNEEKDSILVSEQDIEPFPFLDLPFEIRKLVYDQVIEPFLDTDDNIYMHLGPPNDEMKPHPIRKRHSLVFHGDSRVDRQMNDPPYQDGDEHLHVEYENFQIVWNLPGVCQQIREEFAPIFWAHVALNCPVIVCVPNEEFGHIEEFLEHRYRAVKTMKSFSWGLMLESNNADAQQDLERLFTVAHNYIDIDAMTFNIIIDGGVAKNILKNPDLPWVKIFRSIRKNLWLDEDLEPTLRKQLHDLLNPTLLANEVPTVQDKYLLAREA